MSNVNSDSCSYWKASSDDTTDGNRSLLGNDFVLSRHITSASAGADTRSRQTKRHVSMRRARVCLFSVRERVVLRGKIQDFMRSENPQHLVTSCDFSNAICDFSNKKNHEISLFQEQNGKFSLLQQHFEVTLSDGVTVTSSLRNTARDFHVVYATRDVTLAVTQVT